MAKRKKLTFLIRCPGRKPIRLEPGQRLTVGRHHTNDVVLDDGQTSRFHAKIEWDRDEDRPFIVDNQSANGVEVDGDLIEERQYLQGGNAVGIGETVLTCELREEEVVQDHLLSDSDEGVTLFSDKGKELQGSCDQGADVEELLVQLEEAERTGTLRLTAGEREVEVVYSQGVIAAATGPGPESGRGSLTEALALAPCEYRFTKVVSPSESFLGISARTFLGESGAEVDATHLRIRRPDEGEEE